MRTRILILGLTYLLMLGSAFSVEKADILNHNWQSLFTEPIETLYIITKDSQAFKYSNQNEVGICVDVGRLEGALRNSEGKGYGIGDIAIFIHNHLTVCRFSSADRKLYRTLKEEGFNGLFLVYCHTSKKTYDIEGDKKSN